jgi:hypothetical protein
VWQLQIPICFPMGKNGLILRYKAKKALDDHDDDFQSELCVRTTLVKCILQRSEYVRPYNVV